MSDKLAIWNRALMSLGAERLADTAGTSTVHLIIDGFYESGVEAMFLARPWSWATGLEESTGTPLDNGEWLHAMLADPVDAKVLKPYRIFRPGSTWTGPVNVHNSTVPTDQVDWRYDYDGIVTGYETVVIQWQGRLLDEEDWPESFANAVAARLAFDICMPITKSMDLKRIVASEYQARLQEAERDDDTRGRTGMRQATSLVGVR